MDGWPRRRRIGEMVLPVVTTATGAFLVVLVFGMSDGIRAQSASLGHADEIGRAVVLIAVTVLLVGVVEVAVATTRTVAHRTRELGRARRQRRAARAGGGRASGRAGDRRGAGCPGRCGVGGVDRNRARRSRSGAPRVSRSVGWRLAPRSRSVVSIVAALATSIVPTWNAASRSPIRSLTAGG